MTDEKEPKPIYKKVWFWMVSILIVLTTIGLIKGPGSQEINRQQVGGSDNQPAASQKEAEAGQPVKCDSEDASEMVKNALEGSSNAFREIKVLDFGKAQETFFQPEKTLRGCRAEAELSTGGGLVTYQLYFGPSGKALVQVQTGANAEMQLSFDEVRRGEIAKQKSGGAVQPAPADNNGQETPAAPQNEEQEAPVPADTENQQPASEAAPKADQ